MSSNEFKVKKIEKENITLEEEKDEKKTWLLLFWRKYGNLLTMILIFLAITIFTVGTGIAISRFYNNANEKVEVTINTVVEFIYGDKFELPNTYPMTERQADALYQKGEYKEANLKIKNLSTVPVKCKIVLAKNVNETTLKTDKLYYKLKKGNEFLEKSNLSFNEYNEAILYTFKMEPKATEHYNLRMWVDETADNSYQGKIFKGKVKVYFDYISE